MKKCHSRHPQLCLIRHNFQIGLMSQLSFQHLKDYYGVNPTTPTPGLDANERFETSLQRDDVDGQCSGCMSLFMESVGGTMAKSLTTANNINGFADLCLLAIIFATIKNDAPRLQV